jgi:hypothetical protein
MNIIEDAKYKNKEIHVLYLDFSKAYDRIEWNTLINSLNYYKFPKTLINIITEILKERKGTYITPLGLSQNYEIQRGLPQGDTISPTLFNVFINKLLDDLSNSNYGYKMNNKKISHIAFADDITLIAKNKNQLRQLLGIVNHFCNETGYMLNIDKCVYTSRSQNYKRFTYKDYMNEKTYFNSFDHNESIRYLGIYINLDLNWKGQFEKTKNNLTSCLKQIRSKMFNIDQTIKIINLLIIPKIRFILSFVKFK